MLQRQKVVNLVKMVPHILLNYVNNENVMKGSRLQRWHCSVNLIFSLKKKRNKKKEKEIAPNVNYFLWVFLLSRYKYELNTANTVHFTYETCVFRYYNDLIYQVIQVHSTQYTLMYITVLWELRRIVRITEISRICQIWLIGYFLEGLMSMLWRGFRKISRFAVFTKDLLHQKVSFTYMNSLYDTWRN